MSNQEPEKLSVKGTSLEPFAVWFFGRPIDVLPGVECRVKETPVGELYLQFYAEGRPFSFNLYQSYAGVHNLPAIVYYITYTLWVKTVD